MVREIYRLLHGKQEARRRPAPTASTFIPMGVEANRKALELVVQYSVEQQIIPRAFTVDELFDGAATAIGKT